MYDVDLVDQRLFSIHVLRVSFPPNQHLQLHESIIMIRCEETDIGYAGLMLMEQIVLDHLHFYEGWPVPARALTYQKAHWVSVP